MKKVIVVLTILISFLAIGCTEGTLKTADQPKDAQESNRKANNDASIYPGIVSEVDLKSKTITIQKENQNLAMLFHMSEAKLNGYKSADNIKSGDKVEIKYKAELGKMYALVISKK